MSDASAPGREITVRYFAWVREKTGKSQERIALAAGIETVADLVDFLAARGDEYAAAFASRASVRAAVDMTHVKPDASLAGAREVAFFPPVTGG